jgi:hypothetical protein
MKAITAELRALERRSISARANYDAIRAATTQANNAAEAMANVAKTADDATLKAALQGYATFSDSMSQTLESRLQALKGEINECASVYGEKVFGIKLGDRVSARNVTNTGSETVIEVQEMGIESKMSSDGVHKQVYICGPRIGKNGNVLKRSSWMMLGNEQLQVTKQ